MAAWWYREVRKSQETAMSREMLAGIFIGLVIAFLISAVVSHRRIGGKRGGENNQDTARWRL